MARSKAPLRTMVDIGVVVHGPEVIDSGNALKVLTSLESLGKVTAVLGGTMGRVAVIDAGLENVIDISRRKKPSESIRDMQSFSDLVVLLNQAKTRETGLAFGAAVSAQAGVALPLIQVDCGGGFVAKLSGEDNQHIKAIADLLSLELLDLPVRHKSIIRQGNSAKRSLTGVVAGEPISINGCIVAKATDSHVEIYFLDGKIINIIGAQPKTHGIEKLPLIDCEKAIIRSGDIRRTEGKLKAKQKATECKGQGAVIIDHCAEDAFEMAKGASIAVTIGDDTTAIAGDILARLGIPVIGIVDGDLDCLSHKTAMLKGSILIRVDQGHDDIVGRRIRQEVFLGNGRASVRSSELFEAVMKIAGNRTVQVERL